MTKYEKIVAFWAYLHITVALIGTLIDILYYPVGKHMFLSMLANIILFVIGFSLLKYKNTNFVKKIFLCKIKN